MQAEGLCSAVLQGLCWDERCFSPFLAALFAASPRAAARHPEIRAEGSLLATKWDALGPGFAALGMREYLLLSNTRAFISGSEHFLRPNRRASRT